MLSQHQKFHTAHIAAQELLTLTSEVEMAEFELHLSLLKQLRDIWTTGGAAVQKAVPAQALGEFLRLITVKYRLNILICAVCFAATPKMTKACM